MVQLDPMMGSLGLGASGLSVEGSSTPVPSTGTDTPVVVNEPVKVDETNVVGKEDGF